MGGVIARTMTIKRDKSCGLAFTMARRLLPKENFTTREFFPSLFRVILDFFCLLLFSILFYFIFFF